jgi:hypothetical protein
MNNIKIDVQFTTRFELSRFFSGNIYLKWGEIVLLLLVVVVLL